MFCILMLYGVTRTLSKSLRITSCILFHGGNTGSNPVGDANLFFIHNRL
jgi:hypothetical protein